MTQTYRLSDITAQLGGEWRGEDIAVQGVQPLAVTQAQHIGFWRILNTKQMLLPAKQVRLLASAPKWQTDFAGRNLIVAADPYLYFAKVARFIFACAEARAGIHPTAVIEPGCGTRQLRDWRSYLYWGTHRIGRRLSHLLGAVVEHDCVLGDEVVLHPNSVIYCGCTLGNRVAIHGGSVIGADGFGLAFAGDSWF